MRNKATLKASPQLGFRTPSIRAQGAVRTWAPAIRNVPLCVMKFGGSSVGDAVCIERVARIIKAGARTNRVVVVLSAMRGVTDLLVEAVTQSERGKGSRVAIIFRELRARHEVAANRLIVAGAARSLLAQHLSGLFRECESLCQKGVLAKEVAAQTRDAIISLGERLTAPLVAAALAARGVASEAIEATKLIVTDANYGSADPCMDATRQRCHSQLVPLFHRGIVPVVTGFIGATSEGLLTTLGRGGSDYSATILGAALDAREVIIWTDVAGVLTADPRLVSGACTIAEVSYREAAELAKFGAKVLHPKTLRPVMHSDIPVWIRNSFVPEQTGTKITPNGVLKSGEVKAISLIADATLIAIAGTDVDAVRDIIGRSRAVTTQVRGETWFISRSAARSQFHMAVGTALADQMVELLREEFADELSEGCLENIEKGERVAIVTLVGQGLRDLPAIRRRACRALGRVRIKVSATAEGVSGLTLSFGIIQNKAQAAMAAIHQEFQLHALDSRTAPLASYKYKNTTK